MPWPGNFGDIIVDNLYKSPTRTMALTFNAPSVAKKYGTTPEALKAVIERFDCFFF